ncbi:hypothetical protein KOW79_017772 [Hemibagrus wyckioides]|uniref:Uncharacterized protein n=1 Tax=Hemibagrus wyckioides TaxID=337641 RepID=A0A9D3NAE1_9TELE|nr:hypothetical protein KOW79_017772 [Hemibagrus wyckioides]
MSNQLTVLQCRQDGAMKHPYHLTPSTNHKPAPQTPAHDPADRTSACQASAVAMGTDIRVPEDLKAVSPGREKAEDQHIFIWQHSKHTHLHLTDLHTHEKRSLYWPVCLHMEMKETTDQSKDFFRVLGTDRAVLLAREVGPRASADDSVCPLTHAARELAASSNDNVFFRGRSQRNAPDVISVEQHGAAGSSPVLWSPAERTDSR